MSAPEALVLEGIHYRFGSTAALLDASLRVRRGTLHALLGENGAGKTTLLRIAFGLLRAERGQVSVHGTLRRFRSSGDAIAAGIGMVHQHFQLIPALSVAENVALGGRGLLRERDVRDRLRTLADRVGLPVDPSARVERLSVSAQQRVEILKALSHDADLLILDEPTAVLTPDEATTLLEWVRDFVSKGGTAVLITHKLREALRFADDITVLRRGTTTLAAAVNGTAESALVAALTGAPDAPLPTSPLREQSGPSPNGSVRLELKDAGYEDERGITRLNDATLEIRGGEVVGVLGVEGSGHRELLRLLAGRLTPSRGTARIPDRVGFVPEDRLADALVPAFSLPENLALAEAGRARGRMDWDVVHERTRRLIGDAGILSATSRARMDTLSGGNQQKFVVAREQAVARVALVAEHPTRGLDLRASARVLEELRRAASDQGTAVVVHSPDLDEVLAIATRVVACFDGRVREVPWPADRQDRTPFARALVGAT